MISLQKVFQVVADALNIDVGLITLESSRDSLVSWDSFGQISIAVNLEVNFGISLNTTEMFTFRNISEILNILKKYNVQVEIN